MAASKLIPGRRRQTSGLFMIAICLALPMRCWASNHCAWLNEATASGLLGGDAVGEATVVDGQPTVCMFTQMMGGAKRTLRLTVEIVPEAHDRVTALVQSCGSDVAPIKAIGNEASFCSADDRKGVVGERVVGRVRDQVFTITIASTVKNDPVLTREVLKSHIYTAAEQVAGNLF